MKKMSIYLMIIIILIGIFVLGFGTKKNLEPNNYYEVYLDDQSLGIIKSKTELEKYIDENGKYYKRKFGISKIYSPKGLTVKKITTYSSPTISVSSLYKKISKKADFTVRGYEFIINKKVQDADSKKEKIEKQSIYVLDKKVMNNAINTLIETFVGKDRYKSYIDDNQVKIETTGENIENVYINEDITLKKTNISVKEKIYSDETELTNYLLYGTNRKEVNYIVKAGDTIESVAFNNQVSPEELLISNEDLNSTTNLLYPSQKLLIAQINPQISVVEESYVVKDIESRYKTEEKYDDNAVVGQDKVIQNGENGLDRVSQKVKKINGNIVYVDPQGKQSLKEPISRIVVRGNKYVPEVGNLHSWGWPTDSGWTLSSGYVYRNSPVGRGRELHTGLDISGTGYGSKIYATNNGRVMIAERHYSYGNYVVINHNNGYMTLYGHMSRIVAKAGQLVERGQVIGYVGCTGDCTGPHVHYEIWKGCKYCHVNPSVLYPGGYR